MTRDWGTKRNNQKERNNLNAWEHLRITKEEPMTYQFIKDYKNNDAYRLSFNRLARQTFSIDFEKWYQEGFWNENYVCYSFHMGNEIVSNASLNTMELIIEGTIKKAIQIGTVMTDPSHRRQGLALKLISKILEDYDPLYHLYFLAADDEAVPLYEKCGFKYSPENKYLVDLSGYKLLDKPLEPVRLKKDIMLALKRKSEPLSEVLSARGDQHVLMFYYTLGFENCIYEALEEVYAIFEVKDSTLHLYDILSDRKVNLMELIECITPKTVNKIFLHFTPEKPIKGLKVELDETSNWMIRSKGNFSFPKYARFPRISQT